MENKIHDDQLDDYVRRSFEDYEEDPAPEMWGRIEGNLPPQTQPRLSYFRRCRWQAAAAAAVLLLLCGLVYEYFYYEQKIRDLKAEKIETQEFPKQKPEVENSFFKKNTPQNEQSGDFKTSGRTPSGYSKLPDEYTPSAGGDIVIRRDPSNFLVQTSEVSISKNKIVLETPGIVPMISNHVVSNQEITGEKPAVADSASFAKIADFPSLATSIFPVKIERQTSINRLSLSIEPVREPSGWYIGLQSMPHITFDNAKTPVRRPGGPPIFVSRQESPEISTDWWLKVGKKLNSRLSLESGVGYSELSRTATHTPRFRFGEGIFGSNPHRRNFSYDLNTYGGSVAVSLRVEQVDSDPVQDDEPISLVIKTFERAQLLRVPLLVGYRLGSSGRWKGIAKAGLTGNFFLKNELDIATRVSQNSRFQPVQGSDSYTVQLENQGKFFLGYWFSAGAEFQMNRHVSLLAEPSFYGDFPRKDARGRSLPGQFSLGLNVGVNYYF